MSRIRKPFPLLLPLLGIAVFHFLIPSTVSAYDIEEEQWGFNGKVILNEINPLFLRIRNNSSETEEFTLSIKRESYGNKKVGARIHVAGEEGKIFLSPLSERWVTFYIYITSGTNSVVLENDRKRVPIQVPQTNYSEKKIGLARVLFSSGTDFNYSRKAFLPKFSEDVFPPHLSGTDTLGAVFLDEVPRWQPEQKKTFKRWIDRGGIVHLLQSRSGSYPQFDEELIVLNAPLNQQHIGNGLVLRHPFQAEQLDKDRLEAIAKQEQKIFKIAEPKENANQENQGYYNQYSDDFQNIAFNLKEHVNPHHSWAIIYTISLFYLLLVFPGAYMFNRWKKDYRITYGFLLTSVFCFSVLFNIIGARGYGESTQINSVAVAKVLPNDELDITQYSNAFVTRGDRYEFTHQGTGTLYSASTDIDNVLGDIVLGTNALFNADIPPFSSRPFLHRTLIKEAAPTVELTSFDAEKGLESLKLNIDKNIDQKSTRVWAIWDTNSTELNAKANWAPAKKKNSLSTFLQGENQYYNGIRFNSSGNLSTESIQHALNQILIRKYLQLDSHEQLNRPQLKQDRVYVFLSTKMPESLHANNSSFEKQSGHILYAYELLLSE